MPEPEKNENEKDFLKRCIPQLIKEEEYPQKQAVAICYSMYRKKGTEAKSPKPVKKLSKNDKMKLYLTDY
jgi:hypothetical protein